MNLTITPGKLSGTITPPPSKSLAHRYLIAAALAGEGSVVHNLADSLDIRATRRCMAELNTNSQDLPDFNCGESGSTLRFLIPLALALRGGGIFTGRGRLMERPQKPYFDIFDEKGIFYEQKGGTLTVRGELTPGEYRLPGNVSTQFVTGLLYALPLLDGDSEIVLTSRLEGWGYVDMTLNTLEKFGITTEERDTGWIVPGRQVYQPCGLTVEADWSQAAFWYAAEFLGNSVQVSGMPKYSRQGDSKFAWFNRRLAMPRNMGFSVADCPDLVPPLAAMAALRNGYATYMGNAARLRLKESDRLATVAQTLNALGAQVEEGPDFLKITGKDGLAGGVTVDCCNDHRIAMMAAIAATRCIRPITITGAECVAKSYPDFWEEYERLGGKLERGL